MNYSKGTNSLSSRIIFNISSQLTVRIDGTRPIGPIVAKIQLDHWVLLETSSSDSTCYIQIFIQSNASELNYIFQDLYYKYTYVAYFILILSE